MGVHRCEQTNRISPGPPPKIRVGRSEVGTIELLPEQKSDGVHPEPVAAEKPPMPDDPRSSFERNAGPYAGF